MHGHGGIRASPSLSFHNHNPYLCKLKRLVWDLKLLLSAGSNIFLCKIFQSRCQTPIFSQLYKLFDWQVSAIFDMPCKFSIDYDIKFKELKYDIKT